MHTRNSHGLDQFCGALQERPGLTILDLAGANQQTITFVTQFGHRLYSDDMVMQIDRIFGVEGGPPVADAETSGLEAQTDVRLVSKFLETTLPFPANHFDGILLWDSLEFMGPVLLDPMMKRLHKLTREGSTLFALFHAEDKSGLVESNSYRISDHKTILMTPRGKRKPAQFFNNRGLEKLFAEFDSVKFFLTRDNLREVIVRR